MKKRSISDTKNALNPEQQKAVEYVDGHSIILAGAGSGKTRVLVAKAVHLIEQQNVDPLSIVMITFTNKAGGEMKKRIQEKLGLEEHLGFVGTFHTFCAHLLRIEGFRIGIDPDFVIYDDDDQTSLMKSILKKHDDTRRTPSYYLYRISTAKNLLIPPQKYAEIFTEYASTFTAQIYFEYQKALKKNHAVDFDDLLMKAVELLKEDKELLKKLAKRYCYIFVDEFQDTNFAQYSLVRLFASAGSLITAVGDFSQSIYSWRGADVGNLKKFTEDFSGSQTFSLEHNYRSTQTILDFAFSIISQNNTHPVLQLYTDKTGGEEVTIQEMDTEEYESRFIADTVEQLRSATIEYKDFAVLYRTNAQSRSIEEMLLRYGIPYTLIGGTRFYDRKEVKDVLAYLRLLLHTDDEVATERIQKLGKTRWKKYQAIYPSLVEKTKEAETIRVIDLLLRETGYLDLYDSHDEDDYSRLENIKELKSVAAQFPRIPDFLEQVALVESEYSQGEKRRQEGIRLMTLHQAKGLEFPYVFIVGVEEGILPHVKSVDDQFQLEEERRLFYVGITRAKTKLFITYARRRFLFGRRTQGMKSRFLGGEEEEKIYDGY